MEVSLETLEFTNLLVDAMLDKKGNNILLLDTHEQCIFADYFLICNGDSDRQLKALSTSVVNAAKQEARELALGIEGKPEDGWMLVDFGHVVVHLFSAERREYYNLEELWQDARVVLRMQ